jgi:hypothetical protein
VATAVAAVVVMVAVAVAVAVAAAAAVVVVVVAMVVAGWYNHRQILIELETWHEELLDFPNCVQVSQNDSSL